MTRKGVRARIVLTPTQTYIKQCVKSVKALHHAVDTGFIFGAGRATHAPRPTYFSRLAATGKRLSTMTLSHDINAVMYSMLNKHTYNIHSRQKLRFAQRRPDRCVHDTFICSPVVTPLLRPQCTLVLASRQRDPKVKTCGELRLSSTIIHTART